MAEYYLSNHKIEAGDLEGLLSICENNLTRATLCNQLFEMLVSEHYVRESDSEGAVAVIRDLVQDLSKVFPDLEEFRILVRRAGKMLPEKLSMINPKAIQAVQQSFSKMHHDTQRQCLSAEVEIKLRNVYFDRAEPARVSEMVADIYDHVESLEDVQFLVKYATQLLPPRPQDVSGSAVWDSICVLQKELSVKREKAVSNLVLSLRQLYPEQTEERVRERATEVSQLFQRERFATKRELNSMSRLVAECGRVFPLDFESATPATVYSRAQSLFKNDGKLA
eukprot:CAMPEP_0182419608 /NCGR_PEP_ID=MMETSP1167-20130531/4024_1 /TAXON_ID=2988 /ORGANISM="Mallomonas Sp, Strain CCMP3275" /LENGTH=279 /DNA_ID=CAMNT_0024594619 /DNA_START=333 /DNA_END=1172 /DNA_ORIENTATION=-